MEKLRWVPAGKRTVPPPAADAAAMARWEGRSVEGLAIAGGAVGAHVKLGGDGACEQEHEHESPPSDAEVRVRCGGKHGRNHVAQRGATATARVPDRPTGMTQLH